jgi:hypothetical protein
LIQDELRQEVVPGDQNSVNLDLFNAMTGDPYKVNWQHDYFTAAMNTPQLGAPIELPLFKDDAFPNRPHVTLASGGLPPASTNINTGSATFPNNSRPISVGVASLSISNPEDIAAFRLAYMLQEWVELFNRIGLRYKDVLRGAFGSNARDYSVDIPEYIGGSKGVIPISDVLSNTQTLNTSDQVANPVGSYSGYATMYDSSRRYKYHCPEHGYIFCMLSIVPETGYFQGLHKHWSRISPCTRFCC